MGPSKWRKRRSPQIVRLLHVLILNMELDMILYVLLSFSAVTNFVCGNQLPSESGMDSLTAEDLKRYGVGGGGDADGEEVEYARIWEGCATKDSPIAREME